MKTDPKIEAFESSLKKIQAGANMDQALEGYSHWAGELQPMLEAVQVIRQVSASIHVPKAAQARSQARFLQAATQGSRPGFNLFSFIPLHFGLVTVILLLVLVFGGASTIAASGQALPGDRLYPVKRLVEEGRLLLVQAPAHQIELEQRFDRERLAEVEALAEQGRGAEVRFAGSLDAAGEGQWRVGDLLVRLAPGGQVSGGLEPGIMVQVEGTLQPDGLVMARRIEAHSFEIKGVLQGVVDQQWMVDGTTFRVNPQTRMTGSPGLGSQLQVRAIWLADGDLLARSVEVLTPGIQPLPVASATPRPAKALETLPAGAITTAQLEPEDDTATVAVTKAEGVDDTAEPQETETAQETESRSRIEDDHSGGPSIEPSRTPKPKDRDEESRTPEPSETHEPEHTEHPEDDSSGSDDSHDETRTPEPTNHSDDD